MYTVEDTGESSHAQSTANEPARALTIVALDERAKDGARYARAFF
jgi:hypothetical protein